MRMSVPMLLLFMEVEHQNSQHLLSTNSLLGADIQLGRMPPNEYYEHFAPEHSLFVPASKAMENQNRWGLGVFH